MRSLHYHLPASPRLSSAAHPSLAADLPCRQAGDNLIRPLLPIRGAVSLLGVDEDAVLQMVEEGRLLWAWDVAVCPQSARSKELRLLPECIEDHCTGLHRRWQWPDVVQLVFRGQGGNGLISARWTSLLLNTCVSSVYSLIQSKELAIVSRPHRGPKGSAMIRVLSLEAFLRRRCWPHPQINV